ncbi:hypothetical protein CEXT_39681 [Caerostris extrusa]|uniref:Uncharacterized protein n=1 Tax=Caerostris extrusa TaxID=172846 RepID=A0AAV4PXI7_CAEEX|nr:hypothetical protein CEXT_39681 [Caerostris extrusa]
MHHFQNSIVVRFKITFEYRRIHLCSITNKKQDNKKQTFSKMAKINHDCLSPSINFLRAREDFQNINLCPTLEEINGRRQGLGECQVMFRAYLPNNDRR